MFFLRLVTCLLIFFSGVSYGFLAAAQPQQAAHEQRASEPLVVALEQWLLTNLGEKTLTFFEHRIDDAFSHTTVRPGSLLTKPLLSLPLINFINDEEILDDLSLLTQQTGQGTQSFQQRYIVGSKLRFDIDGCDLLTLGLYAAHYYLDRSFIAYTYNRAIKSCIQSMRDQREQVVAAVKRLVQVSDPSDLSREYSRFLVTLRTVVLKDQTLLDITSPDIMKMLIYIAAVEGVIAIQSSTHSFSQRNITSEIMAYLTYSTLLAGKDVVKSIIKSYSDPNYQNGDPVHLNFDVHINLRHLFGLVTLTNILPIPNQIFLEESNESLADFLRGVTGTSYPLLSSYQMHLVRRVLSLFAYMVNLNNQIAETFVSTIDAHKIEFFTIYDALVSHDLAVAAQAEKDLQIFIARYLSPDLEQQMVTKNNVMFVTTLSLLSIQNIPFTCKVVSMLFNYLGF